MEYVAQKLGFIKCAENKNNNIEIGKRMMQGTNDWREQGLIKKKRKLSQEDQDSSNSSLGFSDLKITDSSESENGDKKNLSIPIPIRPIETKSLICPPETNDFASLIGKFPMTQLDSLMPYFSFNSTFPSNQYLSFLVAPYGTPSKLIGPITQSQRKQKVNRYLQKKKNRQWKNVKYTVRQQLAENRKRVQGRFVKSQKKWRWNEIIIDPQVPMPTNTQQPKQSLGIQQQQLK